MTQQSEIKAWLDGVEPKEERVRITVYVSKDAVELIKRNCSSRSMSQVINTILKQAVLGPTVAKKNTVG